MISSIVSRLVIGVRDVLGVERYEGDMSQCSSIFDSREHLCMLDESSNDIMTNYEITDGCISESLIENYEENIDLVKGFVTGRTKVEFERKLALEQRINPAESILPRNTLIWARSVLEKVPIRLSISNIGILAVILSILMPRSFTYILIYPIFRLVFGTLYPAYASYKALRTKNLKEYVKWMMYWIVFAIFTFAETFTDIFFSFWFPFYYEIKIILVVWLLSPATKGSSILYRRFVHPALSRRENEIDEALARAKEQGYTAFINFGTKGVNYATNVIMQTAIKNLSNLPATLPLSQSDSAISSLGNREESPQATSSQQRDQVDNDNPHKRRSKSIGEESSTSYESGVITNTIEEVAMTLITEPDTVEADTVEFKIPREKAVAAYKLARSRTVGSNKKSKPRRAKKHIDSDFSDEC